MSINYSFLIQQQQYQIYTINYDVNNNSDVITNGGNNHRNNNNNDTIYPSYSNENKITINDNSININGNTVGNENHPNITSTSSVQLPGNSEIPNLYNVQDILSDSAFDDFIPTLTDNTKDQNNI